MIKKLNKFGIIHFVGIGGIGMSGIAQLMNQLGYLVQGSDINNGNNVQRLSRLGIKVFIGHRKKNISNISVIVFSSAIKKNNPEIIAAKKKRLPVVSRAEMLGELMRFKRSISISGSHGKTTTTSILSSIFEEAKIDPTIVNGGIINSLSTNARMGTGEWMIVEADESDGSFLHLPSEINIITNIDPEHLDYYGDFQKLYNSFKRFASNVPFYGSSIVCLENINTKKLSKEISTREIVTYGINKYYADLNIHSISFKNSKSYFSIIIAKKLCKEGKNQFNFSLNLLGRHNVLNATASIAASLKADIKVPIIKKAIAKFKGVDRRFTYIGKFNKMKIYDDYAHHPVEILASLEIARNLCNKKVIVIFQPHRFSRTNLLFNDFIKVLKKIDILILTNIYSAGEKYIKGLNKKLYNSLKNSSNNKVVKIRNSNELNTILKPFINNNNIIVFMGAGSITNWANKLAQR